MGNIPRLIHRAVAISAGVQAKDYLYPLQVAVGTKGGCDIMVAAAQAAFDAGRSVGPGDIPNAYGTIRRSNIYSGINAGCPSICNFFLWTYSKSSPLLEDLLQGQQVW